jgi:KTSC domain
MNRRPVTSSNVASVGWEQDDREDDDTTTGTLEVEFRSGHVYQYAGVPLAEYEALIGASSVGKYLNARIIGAYDESRIA